MAGNECVPLPKFGLFEFNGEALHVDSTDCIVVSSSRDIINYDDDLFVWYQENKAKEKKKCIAKLILLHGKLSLILFFTFYEVITAYCINLIRPLIYFSIQMMKAFLGKP